MLANGQNDRRLLVTFTGEPFQPVRLTYVVPNRPRVLEILRRLACVVEVPKERCWQWQFAGEAACLRFGGGGYEDVPEEKRPVLLARLRFPRSGGMTLETNSIDRAIAAARFFGPRFGTAATATRCRVVNRCFADGEGDIARLLKRLDENVVVIDPQKAEERFRRDFRHVRGIEDANRAAAASLERRIATREDVPEVEDLPLAPEEETADFRHLQLTLGLRGLRALERWNGNTDLTLVALIVRLVKDGSLSLPDVAG